MSDPARFAQAFQVNWSLGFWEHELREALWAAEKDPKKVGRVEHCRERLAEAQAEYDAFWEAKP